MTLVRREASNARKLRLERQRGVPRTWPAARAITFTARPTLAIRWARSEIGRPGTQFGEGQRPAPKASMAKKRFLAPGSVFGEVAVRVVDLAELPVATAGDVPSFEARRGDDMFADLPHRPSFAADIDPACAFGPAEGGECGQ
jgi:hypothetical protein